MKTVWLIDRACGTPEAVSGVRVLEQALLLHGIQVSHAGHWANTGEDVCILFGLCENQLIAHLLREADAFPNGGAEGVVLHWIRTQEKPLLIAAGTDGRGLLYALLELADRVRCDGPDALNAVQNIEEYPDLAVRGADRLLTSTRDDGWFLNEDFWRDHLLRLARSRINRFTLITGFDTAYMSPPYPFLFDVEGFEAITARCCDAGRRTLLLEAVQRIGVICHEYGIEFFFAIWQQLPWNAAQESLLENMPEDPEQLTRFCAAGVRTLLRLCPEIDGLQYRVNFEAGVHDGGDGGTAQNFWLSLIDAVADARPGRHTRLDLRAKGLTDAMIEHAMARGLDVTVPTKYWCELNPLPYHIPRLRTEEIRHLPDKNSARRYSYDDLLRKPHAYDVLFRIWSFTNCNVFLWGSTENARRLARSVQLAGGIGMTFAEPLSAKGGHQMIPGDAWPLHVSDTMRCYDFEDQRYWMSYLSFGRMGYNGQTDPDVWMREMRHRFGSAAQSMARAYHSASQIMPLVATVHMPVHPTMHYMPELFAGAGLFKEHSMQDTIREFSYATALPSDEQLFASIEEDVCARLDGRPLHKYSQLVVRNWYHALALNTLSALDEARAQIGDNREFRATEVDFTMLAELALFHCWKVSAAYYLCLFEKDGDRAHLSDSHAHMEEARRHWARLAELGDAHYAPDLVFNLGDGFQRRGNWRERLEKEVQPDLDALRALMERSGVTPSERTPRFAPIASLPDSRARFDVPETCPAGQPLRVGFRPSDAAGFFSARMYYRHTNQYDYEYRAQEMRWENGGWTAVIPADYVEAQWDLIVYFTAVTAEGETAVLPGVCHPEQDMPYFWIHTVQQDFSL